MAFDLPTQEVDTSESVEKANKVLNDAVLALENKDVSAFEALLTKEGRRELEGDITLDVQGVEKLKSALSNAEVKEAGEYIVIYTTNADGVELTFYVVQDEDKEWKLKEF